MTKTLIQEFNRLSGAMAIAYIKFGETELEADHQTAAQKVDDLRKWVAEKLRTVTPSADPAPQVRLCWWQHRNLKTGTAEWRVGRVHAWSTDYEAIQDDEGLVYAVGQFPAAIVEDVDTGFCHSVPVQLICFNEDKPEVTT